MIDTISPENENNHGLVGKGGKNHYAAKTDMRLAIFKSIPVLIKVEWFLNFLFYSIDFT